LGIVGTDLVFAVGGVKLSSIRREDITRRRVVARTFRGSRHEDVAIGLVVFPRTPVVFARL
jgi:hypothetical protein